MKFVNNYETLLFIRNFYIIFYIPNNKVTQIYNVTHFYFFVTLI